MDANTSDCGRTAKQSVRNQVLRQGIFLAVFLCGWQSNGQLSLQTLKSFGRLSAEPMQPKATVVEGDDGSLYGVADAGGSNSVGAVFKVNKDGTSFTVLHDFGTSPDDGRSPHSDLLEGSDGALYGTTYLGGISNWGTIFKLNQDGSGFAVLHHFTGGPGGLEPERKLLEGSDGLLYGTTDIGGNAGAGTIFRLSKDGTAFEIIYHFTGGGFYDPSYPTTGVIEGKDGHLYGTCSHGGTWNWGTVFRLEKDGSNFEVLHSFGTIAGDGQYPNTELLQADDGALYGTTHDGGTNEVGVVYKLSTNASSFSILHTFRTNMTDGNWPSGRLIQESNHLLYGTTQTGGGPRRGTIYKIQTNGTGYSIVHNFVGATTDGAPGPNQGLVEGTDGVLYGLTYAGGTLDHGFIYKLRKDGVYGAVYNFTGPHTDGGYPSAVLTEGSDRLLYGITAYGGKNGGGAVFKTQVDGSAFASLHSFTNVYGEPRLPIGGVIEGADGKLYGATQVGGTANLGTIFSLSRDGSNFITVHQFTGGSSNGATPLGRLLEGRDGLLYGTTSEGGSSGKGTVFRLKKDGSGYTNLHRFSGGTDGASPHSGLIQGADRVLYGTTQNGGPQDSGTVFKLNTNGTGYAVLHSFAGALGDGALPVDNLVESRNGLLYGTTSHGGSLGRGIVFTIAKDGSGYSVLHSFGDLGDDASVPLAGVIEANDGALYGTTAGAAGGTIFRLNRDGSGYSVLHIFRSEFPGGFGLLAALTQGANGKLYGSTYEGGEFNQGTLFSLEFAVNIAMQLTDAGCQLRFSGFAGATYEVQRALDVTGPWEPIDSQIAPASGIIESNDPSPLPGTAFYRVHVVPQP